MEADRLQLVCSSCGGHDLRVEIITFSSSEDKTTPEQQLLAVNCNNKACREVNSVFDAPDMGMESYMLIVDITNRLPLELEEDNPPSSQAN